MSKKASPRSKKSAEANVESLISPMAPAAAAAAPPREPEDLVLSIEQTNAALSALQEASTLVIDGSTSTNNAVEVTDAAAAAASNKKRKAETEASSSQPPQRRRSAPTRVSWDDRIAQLQAYKDQFGNLLIPIRYKVNPSLGKFVHNTREQYKLFHKMTPAGYKKKCSLTAERIQQLEALGFVWNTQRKKRQDEDWDARLEQLKAYKEKYGDCMVPHGYKEDPSFAEWIHRQRTTYASHVKEGRKNPMVEDRSKRLEEIGFKFTVHSNKWAEFYELLKEYKEINEHCNVPTHYDQNPKLGRWVHTQRHQHRLMIRGKKSSMTKERVAKLTALGFSWEVRHRGEFRQRATWRQRFEELQEFKAKNDNFLVKPEDNMALNSWAHEQKQRLKLCVKNGKGTTKRMGLHQLNALAALGFTHETELVPRAASAAKKAGGAHVDEFDYDEEDEDDEEEIVFDSEDDRKLPAVSKADETINNPIEAAVAEVTSAAV